MTATAAVGDTAVGRAQWRALGCLVVLAVTEPEALALAAELLAAELTAVDETCSRFREDSELRGVERAGGRWTPVSGLLAEAITVACEAAEATGGLVDPTVGGALCALGYDRDFAEIRASAASVTGTGAAPGWRNIELDRARSRIRVPAGVRIDLGATAKAWAADRAARLIADATGTGVLVGLGGDVAMAGPPPVAGWPVAVAEDAQAASGPVTVALDGGGCASSSTEVRSWLAGGRRMHHIVDPRTGQPAPVVWRLATITGSSCVAANTATTAAIVLGAAAPGWLARLGLPTRLVAVDGSVLCLNGWPVDERAASAGREAR